jgi:anti-sigma-K factor RskA
VGTPDRERAEELVALHALGTLTTAEREELAQAVREDPSLAREAQAMTRVAVALCASAPSIDPPAALRDRVIASATGQVPRAEPASVIPQRARPRVAWSALPGWLAAAAALLAALWLYNDRRTLRTRLGETERRLASAERQVVDMQRTLGETQDRAQVLQAQASVLIAPDLTRIDLTGQKTAPGASARAFWSRARGMVFAASSLPALPADKTYQVWVVLPSARPPISAGLIAPDPAGSVNAHFVTPSDIPNPAAIAVTLEPSRGMPQPTGEKVLVGTVGP